MTQRERILLGAIVAIGVLWFGWKGLGSYQASLSDKRNQLTDAQRQLDSTKLDILRSQEAMLNLEDWQERSLPADQEVAQTEYRAWLMERLDDAGLEFNNVRRVGARPDGVAYTAITFMAHAEGKLEQVTRFLHQFYDSPQLHKITVLKLNPTPEGRSVGMDLTVEALVVNGATRTEGIVEGSSGRLILGEVDPYLASVKGRNLFVPYTPPRPPRPPAPPKVVESRPDPPPKPKFDDAKHAHLSATIGNGGRWQAWIYVRTTGETLYLNEGDDLKVGLFDGKIRSINEHQIVVESEGQMLRVSLGKHLREGVPIGDVAESS